jgi:protocatechuate 3,4-dioxygenase beta subunit
VPLVGLLVACLVLLVWWGLSPEGIEPVEVAPESGGVAAAEEELSAPLTALTGGAADALHGEEISARAGVGVGVRLAGPGRLRGHVIVRTDGSGVPGARVELLPMPPIGADFFSRVLPLTGLDAGFMVRAEPVAVAESGELGAFSFEEVMEGTWYVNVESPYHVPESPSRAMVLASGSGGPVEIFVRLAGQVFGFVRQRGGEPVRGAKVMLEPGLGLFIDSARDGSMRIRETVTDAEGRFRFPGVAPGRGYEISALGPGMTLSHALDIEVRAGRDTAVVVTAREGGSLSGRVLAPRVEDEGDEASPIAGAHVGIVPRGLRDLRLAGELLIATHRVTDAEGRYEMDRVPAGEVDVLCYAAGYLIGRSEGVLIAEGGLGDVADIELVTGPIASGRVVDSSGQPIAGVNVHWDLVDWNEMEGRGLEITFAPFLSQAVEGFVFPKTAADGSFSAGPFSGEAPHRIDFYKPTYRDKRHRWSPEEEGDEIEVVLLQGGAVEGVVMDLERAEPVSRFTITTSDRIELTADAPGRLNPFTGGQLVEDAAGRFRVESVQPGDVTLTFQAVGYLPAKVESIAVTEGETARGVIVMMSAGGVVRGHVINSLGAPVAGAHVTALAPGDGRFQGGGRRRGRGWEDDEPRPPNIARDMPPAFFGFAAGLGLLGDETVRTDQEGAFELTGVAAGELSVAAFHPDYLAGRVGELLLEKQGSLEGVLVELLDGGGIHGTVKDRNGRPLAGSIVFALSPAQFVGGSTRSVGTGLYQGLADEFGEYRIEHMAAGGYFVVATRGDAALNPLSFLTNFDLEMVTVPAEEDVRLDIIDESAGGTRVFGVVTDRGVEVEHGGITALCFESENMLGVDVKMARVGAGGEYEFSGLAPGEYEFRVSGSGREVRVTVDVPDMLEYRCDVFFPEGGVEGRVVDEVTGEPVAACDVVLRPTEQVEAGGLIGSMIQRAGGAVYRERTDGDGEFAFTRMQAGEYELHVRAPSRPREAGHRLASAEPQTLELAEREVVRGIEVSLRAAIALRGTVVDAQGQAVAGATVAASREDGTDLQPVRSTSKETGEFRLDALAPGIYTLTAGRDGFAPARREGVVISAEEEPEVLELVLGAGIEVIAVVHGADGLPVSGARGRLQRSDTETSDAAPAGGSFRRFFSGEGATGADGRVSLGHHGPGQYDVTVWRGLSRATVEDIVLKEGAEQIEVSVSLP